MSRAAQGWTSGSTGRKVTGGESWLLCCSHLLPKLHGEGVVLEMAQPVEAKQCCLEEPCSLLDPGDGLRSAPDVVKS